jgi:hypothetical protein
MTSNKIFGFITQTTLLIIDLANNIGSNIAAGVALLTKAFEVP